MIYGIVPARDVFPSIADLAWAGGFYDGEGSICCTSNNGRPHSKIQLSLGQKNDDGQIAETLSRFA
jgi:hypothetical protein